MKKSVVALVGRPNVGKSTLFNRLAGERLAIVDDVPGTTRDRLFSEAEWNGVQFVIIDTGGIDPSTGGKEPLSIGSADFISDIKIQAGIAIEEADSILFIVDAMTGVTPADEEVALILRKNQKVVDGKNYPPILLVANKADNNAIRQQVSQFYELGLGEPYPISAMHGTETGDLLDAVVDSFPVIEEEEEDESVKVAIVGKPNVGKSSLLNRLTGEERVIVSPIAGTTRDAIDTYFEFEGEEITLIDTAGIRRRGKIDQGVEKYSVIRSMKAIERADVVLLLIDATSGITAQDTHIAGYILDAWKSVVVIVNKWDAIEKDSYTMLEYTRKIRNELNFMDYTPVLFISALTGQRVSQVLPMAIKVQNERMLKVSTGQFNRIIHRAQDKHSPPFKGDKSLRIYYGNQVRSAPPTFLIHVNDPKLAHFTYMRFLENQIREQYPFVGTPIRLVLKARKRKELK
ncbi:MAG: ribosome biogenesis GTPase Der [Anaerolineaceae bacterium]|nr:ribosome biogenesis GTPase Der [Anaerolineaceae bacterium]